MKVTIVVDDGVMGIDGVFYTVDLTGLPKDVRALQFETGKGGHIELTDGKNVEVTAISKYKVFLDRWYAARDEAKKPPPTVEKPPIEKPEEPVIPKEPSKAEAIAEQIRKDKKVLDSIPKLYGRLMLIEKYLGIRD